MSRNAAGVRAATLPAAFAAVLLAAAAPASAAQAAPADELAVTVVTANGSGCPNAPATAQILPDGTSFTIDFGGYVAWAGGGAPATAFRKNCQFSLQITAPEGMTYAVTKAEYSGFALLNDGVSGVQTARYYFQGQSSTTTVSHRFTGALTDDWRTADVFGPEQLVFAPCDTQRNLNLNTEHLQAGEIGAGARLRIALTPPLLAARDAGQMQLLLLLGAVLEQRWAEHARAHAQHRVAAAHADDFLLDDPRLRSRQAAAADTARGQLGSSPALLAHAVLPELPVRPFGIAGLHGVELVDLLLHRRGQVRRDPGLDFAAKRVELGSIFDVGSDVHRSLRSASSTDDANSAIQWRAPCGPV